MPSDQILFFSSDATQLYKADIFRCLAAPNDFTIQFRYAQQWVHPTIFKSPSKIRNRSGLIVFVAGNNLDTPQEERILTFYPIRFCTVTDAFFDSDTQQVIAILTLGSFVECDIDAEDGPPSRYLTFGRERDHELVRWMDVVKKVHDNFPGAVFFRINSLLTASDRVDPRYLRDNRMSCFDVAEETEYSMEIVYYDPLGAGLSPLTIKQDSDRIEFSNTFAFGAGADLDKRLFHVKTGLLSSRSARVFTTISCGGTDASNNPNYLQILWRISRSKWKDCVFALCVIPGAVGLGAAGLATKSPMWLSILVLPIVAALVATSGGLLYRFFNKT